MPIQNIGGVLVRPETIAQPQTPVQQPVVPQAPARQAAPPPEAPVSMEQVKAAIEDLQQAVQSKAQSLQFFVDGDTRKTVVKVIDSESGEIIRQIPSEELVSIARAIDKMQGLLLKQKA